MHISSAAVKFTNFRKILSRKKAKQFGVVRVEALLPGDRGLSRLRAIDRMPERIFAAQCSAMM